MKPISSLLEDSLDSITVNGNNNNSNTVNNGNTVGDEIDEFLEEKGIKPEGVAIKLSEDLSDPKSLSYYTILARQNKDRLHVLLEALSITKEAYAQGKIRTNKPAYFLGILRKKGIIVKFKKEKNDKYTK